MAKPEYSNYHRYVQVYARVLTSSQRICSNNRYNPTAGPRKLTQRSFVQNQQVGESPVHWSSVESKSVLFDRKDRFYNATSAGNRSVVCVLKKIEPISSKNGLKVAKIRRFKVLTRAYRITEYRGGVSIVTMLPTPLFLLLLLCCRCSLLLLAWFSCLLLDVVWF